MAKTFFKEHNVEYSEKDVANDLAAQKEMIDRSGQFGVPVIDIGGQLIVGYDEPKLRSTLGIA